MFYTFSLFFTELLSKWPLFGSSFFAIKRGGDQQILALNRNGVHFLHLITHVCFQVFTLLKLAVMPWKWIHVQSVMMHFPWKTNNFNLKFSLLPSNSLNCQIIQRTMQPVVWISESLAVRLHFLCVLMYTVLRLGFIFEFKEISQSRVSKSVHLGTKNTS